jgi:hypothetical protein
MIARAFLIAGLVALAACQTHVPPRVSDGHVISPAFAVMAAAEAAPNGYPGTFGFKVARAEPVGSRFFLNSYPDYRDQRNLSVAIAGQALPALHRRYGADLQTAFLGRSIEIDGVAWRRRIDFTIDGRPSGKYYFQTHVDVTRPEQIRIMD